MTPQQFVETLDPPETFRRVALCTVLPLYSISQWLSEVRRHAGNRFDRYSFRINPMRLHGFIDGVAEPRLAITVFDGLGSVSNKLKDEDLAGLIVVSDLAL